jgi:hypothetical protein
MKTGVVMLLLLLCIGCQVPQRVTDDIKLIEVESNAFYEFNDSFLSRSKTIAPEELEKKLKLLTLNSTANQRIVRGLRLLQEYLGSTEYVNETHLAITDEIVRKIAQKVSERLQE